MKSCLWLSVAASLWMTLGAHAAERVALVVGCNAYEAEGLALDTPVNDARRMAALLKTADLGFEVIESTDPTLRDFSRALARFKEQAAGAKVALLYFSGHGLEVDGENYLLPVDAELDQAADVQAETVEVARVLQQMAASQAEAKILILDCCRNNPFTVTKSWAKTKSVRDAVLRELGEAEIPDTTLVCFATGAGRKAAAVLDETSTNSPFTESLMRHLQTRVNVLDMLSAVRQELDKVTGGRQRPAVKTDDAISPILRQLVLYRGQATSPPAAPPIPTPSPGTAPAPSGGRKMAIVTPAQRFNMDDVEQAARQFGDKDRLIFGVKNWVTLDPLLKVGKEAFMDVKIAGIDAPAQFAFIGVPPAYPVTPALRFPTLSRTCGLPDSFYEAIKDILGDYDNLEERWVMQGAMYDFDNDGVPELIIAANKRNEEGTSWDIDMVLRCMVFSFQVPATSDELAYPGNWRLCGTVTGQFIVDVDEDRLILPVGSQMGDDYVYKNHALFKGQGTWRNLSGRWAVGDFSSEAVPKTLPASARVKSIALPQVGNGSPAGGMLPPLSSAAAAGNWRVVEQVLPEKGGYEIVWNYNVKVSGGMINFEGRKVQVNKKPPTKGEAQTRSFITVPAGSLTPEGDADEVNHKGGHLKSTLRFVFDPSFESFHAQNFEGSELASEFTGTRVK